MVVDIMIPVVVQRDRITKYLVFSIPFLGLVFSSTIHHPLHNVDDNDDDNHCHAYWCDRDD